MEILQDRTAKSSEYYSRYNGTFYYYNTLDNKYQHETTKWLSHDNKVTKYVVKKDDTYDSIALYFYNNPTYYWIICDFNRILDPIEAPTPGTLLYIPILGAGLEYE